MSSPRMLVCVAIHDAEPTSGLEVRGAGLDPVRDQLL